jgi:hypothetical protein
MTHSHSGHRQALPERLFEPIQCRVPRLGANMRRREFLGALGGAVAWPIECGAQTSVRRIGILVGTAESDPNIQTWIAEFQDGQCRWCKRKNSNWRSI